ncbi:MAG: crotonase/enoyl-CoA hydratase family protein [Gammaproteobacteria bacterium]|nr:crotonase/enoyl-CoA hydratase family protein [Gammaproteobacteria bacterium]MCP5458639.1 crotonase/enoyl-CoA hydratase family protein [Gammaproteobacteria bacterium]
MSESKISVETQGHVLLIGLNRAEKRNAFDLQMYSDLGAAYGELNSNPELRCGLLYAAGDHFTGGLDLPKWAPAFSQGRFPDLPAGAVDPLGADENNRLRKPLVMAVQGICFTIGIELLLATDIRVAAQGTRFGQIEVKRGIYPVGGATVRFLQEVGWGNAMRYLLTADEFGAEEAYRIGLVQEVVEHGKQFERALAIAETVAKQSPLGVQASLASARIARIDGDKAAFARLLPDLMPIMKSDDAQEGVQAFIERREARFKGR